MASVRLRDATIYGLRIPFVESFTHGTKSRRASDALVVRLTTDEGVSGYGEGIARPYVTGESVDSVVDRIRGVIWPAIRDVELTDDDGLDSLAVASKLLPSSDPDSADVFERSGRGLSPNRWFPCWFVPDLMFFLKSAWSGWAWLGLAGLGLAWLGLA